MLENHQETFANNNGSANKISVVEPVAELAPEAQKQLAGLEEQEPLIPTEYAISSDSTQSEKSNNNPIAKAGFVVTLVGGVMGVLALFWLALLAPKPSTKQVKVDPKPSVAPQISEDETAQLKSQLAFQDQQRDLGDLEKPQPVATPSSNRTAPTIPTTIRPARPTTLTSSPRSVTAPPSIPVRTLPPISVRTPVRAPVPTQTSTANSIAPFERWNQLASLGQTRGESDIKIALSPVSSTASSTVSAQSAASSPSDSNPAPTVVNPTAERPSTLVSNTRLQNVVLGSAGDTSGISPGTQGILSRTQFQTQQQTHKTVIPGSIANAKVAMPMIWDMGSQTTSRDRGSYRERFTVELTEPLLAEDKSVALPASTVFVAQASSVSEGNNVVSANAIAVIYRDASGMLRQEALPEGAVLIRGEGGQALVSKNLHNPRGAVARQDLLIATLNGLGKVGEIINKPKSETVTTGVGFSQTTSQSDPQVWAAALEGVFGVTANRMSQRSDQMIKELLSRPNVKVLTTGSEASVVVSSFFQVMSLKGVK